MGRKKRGTETEERVFRMWDSIAFPDGHSPSPVSDEEFLRREAALKAEWDAVLAIAYQDEAWRVDSRTASMVAVSRWFNAMSLAEYARAVEEIERCLRHPDPFGRHDSGELPIHLHIARLAAGHQEDAARALEAQIDSGIYTPGVIATSILHKLLSLIAIADPAPPGDAVQSLVRAIGVAKRSGKRLVALCDEVRSWDDVGQLLMKIGGFRETEFSCPEGA